MGELPIDIESTETGGYLATSPILPGFLVEGETVEEVYREAPVVAHALLEAYRETGLPLPADLAPVNNQGDLGLTITDLRSG
jgi:predicted RNase H-like HicB family nuclease